MNFKFIAKTKQNRDFLRYLGYKTNTVFIGPERVIINMSRACNFHCLSCWTHSPFLKIAKNKNSFLKTDLFIRLIKDLSALGTDFITLSGAGEPATHPDFYRICGEIKKEDIKYEINSNLSLVDVGLLVSSAPLKIRVNLSAATPETYQHFHQIDAKSLFDEAIQKIKFLKSAGIKIRLVFVLCRDNIHEFLGMVNLAANLKGGGGYVEIKFNPADVAEGTEAIKITEAQAQKLISQISEAQKITDEFGIPNNLNGLKHHFLGGPAKFYSSSYNCYQGWFSSLVDENGEVHFCCIRPGSLGNLNELSFKEIWLSDKYNAFRDLLKKKRFEHPLLKKCSRCLQLESNLAIHNSKMNSLSPARLILQSLIQRR
jgi:MoaA/NifB/PqqE/SkfB family radical SAM enzyme